MTDIFVVVVGVVVVVETVDSQLYDILHGL